MPYQAEALKPDVDGALQSMDRCKFPVILSAGERACLGQSFCRRQMRERPTVIELGELIDVNDDMFSPASKLLTYPAEPDYHKHVIPLAW